MAPAEQAALAHNPGGGNVDDGEYKIKGDGCRRQANRDKGGEGQAFESRQGRTGGLSPAQHSFRWTERWTRER